MKISKVMDFYNFITEKVQSDFFEKNPDFYISRNKKEIQKVDKDKEEDKEDKEEYIKDLKNAKVSDFIVEYTEEDKNYKISLPRKFSIYFNKFNDLVAGNFNFETEYNYKILLAIMNYTNEKSINFGYINKDIINPLFKNSNDIYGIYYQNGIFNLFLSKDKNEFITKLKELKSSNKVKILYTNNKVKGKEITDYGEIIVSKLKNKLKKISYSDIIIEQIKKHKYFYNVIIKDEKINEDLIKIGLDPIMRFQQESATMSSNKTYFGHLKNRFHTQGLDNNLKGIGLGYKIYKALLKHVGYMVSDEQSTTGARNIYYHLLKDDDVYYIIDKDAEQANQQYASDSNKVMVIWKDYPNIKKLLKIVREHELRNGRKYKYDKELLKYIKDI